MVPVVPVEPVVQCTKLHDLPRCWPQTKRLCTGSPSSPANGLGPVLREHWRMRVLARRHRRLRKCLIQHQAAGGCPRLKTASCQLWAREHDSPPEG